MEYHIRDIQISDVQELADLHVLAWKIAYRGILDDSILDALSVEERKIRWENNLKKRDKGVRTIVYLSDEERVLGFLSYGEDRDHPDSSRGELWAIYVHPNVWGQGIGRRMWGFMEEDGLGYKDSIVWVLKENTNAIAFYKSLGFGIDGGEKPFLIAGKSFPEISLTRPRSIR